MAFFSKFVGAEARPAAANSAAGTNKKSAYRGVEVIPHSASHCAAVEEISGYRILAAQAPPLPLPHCDQPGRCKCRYAQYRDRRAGPRRDADVGIGGVASMLQVDDSRSDAPGRREADNDDDWS